MKLHQKYRKYLEVEQTAHRSIHMLAVVRRLRKNPCRTVEGGQELFLASSGSILWLRGGPVPPHGISITRRLYDCAIYSPIGAWWKKMFVLVYIGEGTRRQIEGMNFYW